MIRTFKFKLYKSKKNKQLHDLVGISSGIYNHRIALHRRYYRMYGKTLHKFKLSTHITKLKKLEKYSHWKLVPS
ncbi:MAG: putative transposase, partial [bacterium]